MAGLGDLDETGHRRLPPAFDDLHPKAGRGRSQDRLEEGMDSMAGSCSVDAKRRNTGHKGNTLGAAGPGMSAGRGTTPALRLTLTMKTFIRFFFRTLRVVLG
ncbi:MAG: hypothetical protein Q7U14_15840, partial [Lacisediminimonas sp.]|nr:hypothetical protein [Lacisediminimonas sp.]